jgi:hypothetical protein
VLRFVVEDLQYAEQNLPDASYQAGRVTKYAAKGMLSKVYLYMKDYANAKGKSSGSNEFSEIQPCVGLWCNVH